MLNEDNCKQLEMKITLYVYKKWSLSTFNMPHIFNFKSEGWFFFSFILHIFLMFDIILESWIQKSVTTFSLFQCCGFVAPYYENPVLHNCVLWRYQLMKCVFDCGTSSLLTLSMVPKYTNKQQKKLIVKIFKIFLSYLF